MLNKKKKKFFAATLFVIYGLQGTGKSTVSKFILKKIPSSTLLRSDVIRKELFPKPTYTEEEMQKVYEEMFKRAKKILAKGENVILDATFKSLDNRSRARLIAEEMGVNSCFMQVVINDDNIVRQRMLFRKKDASEALFVHYLNTKKVFETTTGDFCIDNSSNIEDTLAQVARRIFPFCNGSV